MFAYAASIAATWIWAPAIFVSSGSAYFNGIWGLLFFLVPNVLTLVLFPYFAKMVRERMDGYTVTDAIDSAPNEQKKLHLLISTIVLICSTTVQLIGVSTLFSAIVGIPSTISIICIAIISYLLVGDSGLRGSVRTDAIKWVIMLVFGLVLLHSNMAANPLVINLNGLNNPNPWDLFLSFGLPTAIGLLCAPYVDQTFWQRVFSIKKDDIKKTFFYSAVMFGIIPLMFGVIGLEQSITDPTWNIGKAFSGGILSVILAICVLAALISTIDSNLCAISAITMKEFNKPLSWGKWSMKILLVFASIIGMMQVVTIAQMFLIYGTIRTCIAIPTILIILNRYDRKRLFYATLATAIIAPIGFILSTDNKFIFTLIAFALPILGYKGGQENG